MCRGRPEEVWSDVIAAFTAEMKKAGTIGARFFVSSPMDDTDLLNFTLAGGTNFVDASRTDRIDHVFIP